MSLPVKTALLQAIEAMLIAGLPEVPTVKRDWLFPLDLAAVDSQGQLVMPPPVLLFYEDSEELGELGSQIAKNTVPLDLALFMPFSQPVYETDSPAWQSFKDAADVLAGKIHGLWHDRTLRASLRAAGLVRLEELGNRKAPCTESYGEMVLSYRLTYGHALGDAFTLNLV